MKTRTLLIYGAVVVGVLLLAGAGVALYKIVAGIAAAAAAAAYAKAKSDRAKRDAERFRQEAAEQVTKDLEDDERVVAKAEAAREKVRDTAVPEGEDPLNQAWLDERRGG